MFCYELMIIDLRLGPFFSLLMMMIFVLERINRG